VLSARKVTHESRDGDEEGAAVKSAGGDLDAVEEEERGRAINMNRAFIMTKAEGESERTITNVRVTTATTSASSPRRRPP
jgi:hypothetical protein